MNKQNLTKVKLFLMGLESRFLENQSIFKSITVSFKTGLKEFTGSGTYNEGNIKYNFNGITTVSSIGKIFESICNEAEKYDYVSFIYSERGSDILISADNKKVTMKTIDSKDTDIDTQSKNPSKVCHSTEATSSLLNRDYYIKVGKANALLKQLNIMTKEGKIKNDKIRKYNQIDHYVELLDGVLTNLNYEGTLTILDCGCGKSYLSFVLNYYLTEVKKMKCHFIGLDYSEDVINTSRNIAKNLGYRNMEFHAIDIKDYVTDKKINMVLSLHACDTATDMGLALGIKLNSDAIIAVPCCHRELLNQYSYEPFNSITKHGILKARLADTLTDGMRATMLEAKGYDVSVVEYISPLETPKNLMIRAIKVRDNDDTAMTQYYNLMKALNVYPALYKYLNEWE